MNKNDLAADNLLGGFSPLDGTIEFYGRINAIVKAEDVVVDLGAGRASWFHDEYASYSRSIRLLKGKVRRVIGLDVGVVENENV